MGRLGHNRHRSGNRPRPEWWEENARCERMSVTALPAAWEEAECRRINMIISSLSSKFCRAVSGSASRESCAAICATGSGGFRSWPYAASIAVWSNLCASQYLQSKTQDIVAAQKCPDRSNSVWRWEFGPKRKRIWRTGAFPAAVVEEFPRKRPGSDGPASCKSGHDRNQNGHSPGVIRLAFSLEQPALPQPQSIEPVLPHGLHGLECRTWCCGGS